VRVKLQEGTSANIKRLKAYFKANPGALFVVFFQVLVLSAGVLLVLRASWAANEVAVYAIYSLAAGVALQIVVTVREERKRTRASGDGQSKAS
jgi:Kef-type K+ transport system membrane component KefB